MLRLLVSLLQIPRLLIR